MESRALKTALARALSATLCAVGIAVGADARDGAIPAVASDAVSSGEPQAQARLVNEFSGFAGSDAKARNLVAGLRRGSEITLIAPGAGGQPGAATRFVPPTRPMDYGNVRMALVLAREQLAQLDVTQPTPAQISAVLVGGGIASRANGRVATPFLYPGVLQMRAGGMSWARIAATMGVTLAQAMSGKVRPADIPASPDSRNPEAAGAAVGFISVAGERTDVPAPRRAGAAPISSVSITTSSAGGPRTLNVAKPVAPARRLSKGEPGLESPPSKARVLTAADNATRADNVATTVQDGAQRGAVRSAAAAAAHEPSGSEESQAAE